MTAGQNPLLDGQLRLRSDVMLQFRNLFLIRSDSVAFKVGSRSLEFLGDSSEDPQ